MYRTQLSRALMMVMVLGMLGACQPDQSEPAVTESTPQKDTRPAIAGLDWETARARKARLSEVAYDLSIDVAESTEQFSGTAVMHFTLADSAADLTVDFTGGSITSVLVNASTTDINYNGYFLTLPAASLRQGTNTVSITFQHPYDNDGTGLHRFVDPADGAAYLYTYLWPYYANRLFPVFDQPNLKAEIALTVRAPAGWTVVSTGSANPVPQDDGSVQWRFSTTPKMPTYVFSLHAGPYVQWEQDADGVPMRLFARRSLAEYVAVDEWFEVTRRGLHFYGRYFDIPYPYLKYDQLIVPDFNIGAMENIAAVTFSEMFVQRQRSNRNERERRATTILHEMAHMWFGDLVTHQWWNGLWLNESFATQMAAISSLATTEFSDTWHGFFTDAKRTAYGADSRVTTHPIEVPVHNTADFFSVFDAITYQKGSSVLKQLAHYVGEEHYRAGVSAYLKQFAYGNTELEDFVGHQATSSGLSLDDWSDEWLHQAGFNTLQAKTTCANGILQSLAVVQTAPAEHPHLRHHRLSVALYNLSDDATLVRGEVFPVAVSGPETAVELPAGLPCPTLVNPNDQDWAYARIALDGPAVTTLEQYLDTLPDPLTRSMFLDALHNRAMTGEMPLARYVEHAMRLAKTESNIRIQQQISGSVSATVQLMLRLRPETDEALARIMPGLEQQLLDYAAQAKSSDVKYLWFNTWLELVSTPAGLTQVAAILDRTAELPGLPLSPDVRWSLLKILSRHDAVDIDARLAAESAADVSDFGAKSALAVSAARPDKANKARWLNELRNPESLTGLSRQRAVMSGLFPPNQTRLQLELLDQVLAALPQIGANSDPYFIDAYGNNLLTPMCVPHSVTLLQSAAAEPVERLGSTAWRALQDAYQADRECLALRGRQQ